MTSGQRPAASGRPIIARHIRTIGLDAPDTGGRGGGHRLGRTSALLSGLVEVAGVRPSRRQPRRRRLCPDCHRSAHPHASSGTATAPLAPRAVPLVHHVVQPGDRGTRRRTGQPSSPRPYRSSRGPRGHDRPRLVPQGCNPRRLTPLPRQWSAPLERYGRYPSALISAASALPPVHTTATRRPANRSGRASTAARPAAPAPSAKVCAWLASKPCA